MYMNSHYSYTTFINILRTQAIDGRTTLWFEYQKSTRSRESIGTESPRSPHEKG